MGLSTTEQKAELVAILDRLAQLRMNAAILQVRPAADALYDSKLEPWSEYLTGEMGRAPSPYYDPLEFAVAESHKRGLELHVWINPYRSRYTMKRQASRTHVSQTNPTLVRRYGPYEWMDPGDPSVRKRTRDVVFDLVRRYDIDAVHMDDYFYPYQIIQNGRVVPFPDNTTYRRYTQGGGKLGRDDWRRRNVDLLVKELYDGIHEIKPSVRFGLSPFGIWRPGHPASVRGLDQYATLYADARKWLNEGWVDYFTPQLYWSIDRPQQRYDHLLEWWHQQNFKGRNLWPGNYTSKVGFTNASAWRTDEILAQIRLTRAQPGATGNVHFSMEVFMDNPDSLNQRLVREVYNVPALVPASPWLPGSRMGKPVLSTRADASTGESLLELRGTSATGATWTPWLWVVQARGQRGWTTEIIPGSVRVQVLTGPGAVAPLEVRVMPVDRVGILGPTSTLTFR